MLSVANKPITPSVIMLNVVELSVVAPGNWLWRFKKREKLMKLYLESIFEWQK
jgi:hypothetical protein